MLLSQFDYDLPDALIARYPLPERTASRLLCLHTAPSRLVHRQFRDVVTLLRPHDLLICNDTRVIPARLTGQKLTGGHVEMLIERTFDDNTVLTKIRSSKSPKPGMQLVFAQNVRFEMLARQDDLFKLRCLDPRPVADVIDAIGALPLPPYMERSPDSDDHTRYQTVYAHHKGSVASPTAGLHFDHAMLQQIKALPVNIAYVTLHVGSGTFTPVRVDAIEDHRMHPEYSNVSADLCEQVMAAKKKGGRIIAVGTTTLRSLESATQHSTDIQPFNGLTDIFIYPGYTFKCVDVLITNFHLPCSTLLMLVTAFGGYLPVMHAYHTAVAEAYRFFSYGDAMWVEHAP